jgi:hypothetical protein
MSTSPTVTRPKQFQRRAETGAGELQTPSRPLPFELTCSCGQALEFCLTAHCPRCGHLSPRDQVQPHVDQVVTA